MLRSTKTQRAFRPEGFDCLERREVLSTVTPFTAHMLSSLTALAGTAGRNVSRVNFGGPAIQNAMPGAVVTNAVNNVVSRPTAAAVLSALGTSRPGVVNTLTPTSNSALNAGALGATTGLAFNNGFGGVGIGTGLGATTGLAFNNGFGGTTPAPIAGATTGLGLGTTLGGFGTGAGLATTTGLSSFGLGGTNPAVISGATAGLAPGNGLATSLIPSVFGTPVVPATFGASTLTPTSLSSLNAAGLGTTTGLAFNNGFGGTTVAPIAGVSSPVTLSNSLASFVSPFTSTFSTGAFSPNGVNTAMLL